MKKLTKIFAVAMVVLMAFSIQMPVSAAEKATTTEGVWAKITYLDSQYVEMTCYDKIDEDFEIQLHDYKGKLIDSDSGVYGFYFFVNKNKLYSFRIRGIKADYENAIEDEIPYVPYTPWSNSVYFTTAEYKTAQVKKSKKIKVTVPKVAGISNYKVYMSLKKNSGFKKVKTLKSGKSTTVTKFNKKALKAKKTYYFKFVPNKGTTKVKSCRLK